MNFQVVNKTEEKQEFCGQAIPANGSACVHASFVKNEDLEGLERDGNIIFLTNKPATADPSDDDKAKKDDANSDKADDDKADDDKTKSDEDEALKKATADLSDDDKVKVEEAVANGEVVLQLKKDGELTANSIKAIETLLKGK